MRFFFSIFLIFTFFINLDLLSQEDEDIDFGVPGEIIKEVDDSCNLSDDARLLELLDFKLRKFDPNPKDTSEIGSSGQMTPQEIKQAEIRFYNEQLLDIVPVKMRVETFATLGGDTLASLMDRSSRVLLKHPEKCEFFRLYGDQVIGSFEMSFQKILQLYATAINKNNDIAQEFVRNSVGASTYDC